MEEVTISKTVLEILIALVALGGLVWSASKVHTRLTTDINAVGARTTTAQETATEAKILATTAKETASESRQELNEIGRRVAKVEGAIENMRDELVTNRLEFTTMLHNNDKASAERDAKIRESIARVATKLDVSEEA